MFGDDDDDFDYDPLDEAAPPRRTGKGRFAKGSSGNPRGRRMTYPIDPSLPSARRKIISAVADEEVVVKVNGEAIRMSLFEANVRNLALSGTKDRVAAMKFVELAQETSEADLERRLAGIAMRNHYKRLEAENERLRTLVEPSHGVLVVPPEDLENWPPTGLIDDQKRVNMAMVRDLQMKARKREKEEEERKNEPSSG